MLEAHFQRNGFDIIVAGVSLTSTSHAPEVRRRCWNKIAVRGVNVDASSADELEVMFVIRAHFDRLRRDVKGETCPVRTALDRDG